MKKYDEPKMELLYIDQLITSYVDSEEESDEGGYGPVRPGY